MKKNVLILFLFTCTTISFAQWRTIRGNGEKTTLDRSVEAYENIKVSGSYVVTIVDGNAGSISITADENLLEYIETKVKNGTLSIRNKKGYRLRYKEKIEITLTANFLEKVVLSGSGRINSDHKIKGEEMKFYVSGSGRVAFNIDASEIDVKVSGSGKVNLKGETNGADFSISGSGNIDGIDLETKDLEVNISGSGDALVNVTEQLKAFISGSGKVKYKSDGDIRIETKVSGSGKITKYN